MIISSILRRRYQVIICISLCICIYYSFFYLKNPNYDIENDRIRKILFLGEKFSFCSSRSVQRGYNQHVLSVSAYESNDRIELKTNLTWSFIKIFVNEAKKLYPTWIVRVYYYNLINKTKEDLEELEKLNSNLDFCDAENLPVLGNLKNKLPGKMQRFLSAIDPFVGVSMVRDLDSEIFEREVNAVQEWLFQTSYAFHIMRDHYLHDIPMLGGLWGVASNRLSIRDRFTMANALIPPTNDDDQQEFLKLYSGSGDQLFLTHHIWPIARKNSIAHDSFTCLWWRYIYRGDTRPFPTKREHPSCFVGCPKPCCTSDLKNIQDLSKFRQCPSTCRPSEHQDWLFC